MDVWGGKGRWMRRWRLVNVEKGSDEMREERERK